MSDHEMTAQSEFPVPIRLGDRIVGWLATDLAALTAALPVPAPPDTEPPRLLLVPAAPEVLAVRTGRRGFLVVLQAMITHASSKGGGVTIYADAGTFWSDLTLAEVVARFDPRRFLRLDASTVVNLTRLAELIPWTHRATGSASPTRRRRNSC